MKKYSTGVNWWVMGMSLDESRWLLTVTLTSKSAISLRRWCGWDKSRWITCILCILDVGGVGRVTVVPVFSLVGEIQLPNTLKYGKMEVVQYLWEWYWLSNHIHIACKGAKILASRCQTLKDIARPIKASPKSSPENILVWKNVTVTGN